MEHLKQAGRQAGKSECLSAFPILLEGIFTTSLDAQVWLGFNNPLRDEFEVGEWNNIS